MNKEKFYGIEMIFVEMYTHPLVNVVLKFCHVLVAFLAHLCFGDVTDIKLQETVLLQNKCFEK